MNKKMDNFNLREYLDQIVQNDLDKFEGFIKWTENDKNQFKMLLENLKQPYDKTVETTKSKGDRLEELVEFIINDQSFINCLFQNNFFSIRWVGIQYRTFKNIFIQNVYFASIILTVFVTYQIGSISFSIYMIQCTIFVGKILSFFTSQCICPIETMSRACYTINSRRGVTCPILTRRDL